jgi:hypothetical protein
MLGLHVEARPGQKLRCETTPATQRARFASNKKNEHEMSFKQNGLAFLSSTVRK